MHFCTEISKSIIYFTAQSELAHFRHYLDGYVSRAHLSQPGVYQSRDIARHLDDGRGGQRVAASRSLRRNETVPYLASPRYLIGVRLYTGRSVDERSREPLRLHAGKRRGSSKPGAPTAPESAGSFHCDRSDAHSRHAFVAAQWATSRSGDVRYRKFCFGSAIKQQDRG